jgi:hypothetical protein
VLRISTQIDTLIQAAWLIPVSSCVMRPTNAASAHKHNSKYPPAKVIARRWRLLPISHASLTLQKNEGMKYINRKPISCTSPPKCLHVRLCALS